MTSFKRLVAQLGGPDGKKKEAAHGALLKASHRAVPYLIAGLKSTSEDAREYCAEMLGDKKDPSAIPALIEVLDDDCLFVRHDAMWSIEKLCRYDAGGLQAWLHVDFERPAELKRKVLKWWSVNRCYIAKNWRLEL